MFSQAPQDGIVVSFAHWEAQSRDGSPSPGLGLIHDVSVALASGVLLSVATVDLLFTQEPPQLGWRVGTYCDAF